MRFVDALKPNERDVFSAAGLMREPTPIDVVLWWDSVVAFARMLVDAEKMEQAREAESLTLAYERNRLKGLGIEKEPAWKGLDDNFAGYDVLSYNQVNSLRRTA